MNGTSSPASGSPAPTHVRYGVLGFASVLAMITYLDRACIGQVGIFMEKDFGLDANQMGWIKGAFILAYSLFEIPSGWLGDVYGPRRTLLRIVLWWSFFTVLLGLVYPTPGVPLLAMFILIGVNFLFGAGEAGAFPNIGRAFLNWFPVRERGFAQGFLWMAGRFAGGIAPAVVLLLLVRTPAQDGRGVLGVQVEAAEGDKSGVRLRSVSADQAAAKAKLKVGDVLLRVDNDPLNGPDELTTFLANRKVGDEVSLLVKRGGKEFPVQANLTVDQVGHWRHIFWIFGSLGVVWCAAFWMWFRDRPEQHPKVNPAELAYIRGQSDQPAIASPVAPMDASHANIPWRKILTNGNLWLLSVMYFLMSYGWYFILYQLPDALTKHFDVENYPKWQMSLLLGAPMLIGSMACLLGGVLTDLFIRRTGDRKWGRRLFGMIGHVLCALFYIAALLIWRSDLSPWLFVTAITLVSLFNDMTMGATWASCLDIGRRYSGIVAGCMNTIGNLGGLTAIVCAGYFVKYWKTDVGYQIAFGTYALAYVISAILWTRFDATKPVVEDPH